MNRDFQEWDNEQMEPSRHGADARIERILRADDLRRERRKHLLMIALVLIGAALVFSWGFWHP